MALQAVVITSNSSNIAYDMLIIKHIYENTLNSSLLNTWLIFTLSMQVAELVFARCLQMFS